MAIFTGAGVALVTPFREDGSVNFDKLDELIDFIVRTDGQSDHLRYDRRVVHVIRRGAHGMHQICGGAGKGRLPVIAGTGSNATYTTIDMSRRPWRTAWTDCSS